MARSDERPKSETTKPASTPVRSAQVTPPVQRGGDDAPNPVWFKPIMFGLMLFGLLWIIVFYVSGSVLPIAAFGQGNILVGFGILFIGFLMTTRWR